MGKGKKGSRRKEEDDWEDDLQEIAKESGIDLEGEVYVPPVAKKEKKKKSKKESLADNNEEIMEQGNISKPKASFQALMLEDDSPDEAEESDSEAEIEEKVQEMAPAVKSTKQTAGKKGKKKGKATVPDDAEDIDAICAEFELNNAQTDVSKGKKSKKKGKNADVDAADVETVTTDLQVVTLADGGADVLSTEVEHETPTTPAEEQADADDDDAMDDEDDGPKMKTAAQKKAEKKERENKKKEAKRLQKQKEKEKKAKSGDVEDDTSEMKTEPGIIESIPEATSANVDEITTQQQTTEKPEEHADGDGEAAAVSSEDEGDDGTQATKDKKKKKKKKKKEEEKEKKPAKRGVNKSAIKQMQEALEKAKQVEERLRLEEEENAREFEEAEDRRLEKLRLEQEKKDRKKQKDKEKKERLRKEGKLLTPAQKEQKRRAELMLEAMRQQGIQVPTKDAGEQKKVKYVTKKPNKKVQQQQQQAQQDISDVAVVVEKSKEAKEESEESTPGDAVPVVAVKDAEESVSDADNDLPDAWDADSDDDASAKPDGKDVAVSSKEAAATSFAKQTDKDTKGAAVSEKAVESELVSGDNSHGSDNDSSSSDDSDSGSESDSGDTESENEPENKSRPVDRTKETVRERILKRRVKAERNRTQDKLRAPVICVLGHVDTGKTKILDKIRHTNVQDGEAGGITQQIGATMVPVDAVLVQTKMIKEFQSFDLRLPGLLIIDTPGHESFSNLRSRGSNLCDMAILVIDIMHGLEPQTIESINLLRKKQTPFVVALNKVDRLFEWKRSPATQVEDTIRKQKKNTKMEFEERVQIVVNELAEQGLNAALFYKNPNEKSYISLVPTSAHSGDGMGDLMAMICKLTQTRLAEKLAYSEGLESTVMEVKSLPGLGTTIDVILVNGRLKEGDIIITGGIEGPIVTQIRSVLTPQPMRELRIKSQYIQHKEIEAAQGVKLCAKDLERAIAGSPLFVAQNPDEVEYFKREVAEITAQSLSAIKLSERGVYVQASTLGSLEALLEFLKTSKIPYCGVNIGPVHKRDVMRASVMLEHNAMYAVILAFDVKVEREAQDMADKEGVNVFTADIIYHLFDKFTAFTEDYKQKKRDEFKHIAVFPCKLRVLPQHIYNSRDPIVIGVHVEAGSVRLGTMLTVPGKEFCDIGVVTGIEGNHKQLEKCMTGQEVSLKIESTGDAPRMYGRHFTHEDMLMSKITREAIDALKNYFREEMTKQDWQLLIEMKKIFEIM